MREKGVLELPLNAVNHFSVFIIISLLIFTKFKYQKIILFFLYSTFLVEGSCSAGEINGTTCFSLLCDSLLFHSSSFKRCWFVVKQF